jgi:hypothetical protein
MSNDDFSIWEFLGERFPDITVRLCELPTTHAVWVPSERTILLNAALPPEARRSRVAHEAAHMVLLDQHNGHGFFDRRQELRAERLAGEWLLPVAKLQSVELYGRLPGEVAQALGVDVPLLKARVAHLACTRSDELNGRLAARTEGAA